MVNVRHPDSSLCRCIPRLTIYNYDLICLRPFQRSTNEVTSLHDASRSNRTRERLISSVEQQHNTKIVPWSGPKGKCIVKRQQSHLVTPSYERQCYARNWNLILATSKVSCVSNFSPKHNFLLHASERKMEESQAGQHREFSTTSTMQSLNTKAAQSSDSWRHPLLIL